MVQTAVYDSIVVDLELSESKVAELLKRGYESPKLDYKSELDHTSAGSRLRLVKHVLAMANTVGGYVVIGVTDAGERIGISPAHADQLDEANVRGWVYGFSDVPIAIAVHKQVSFEDKLFAIVAILPAGDRLVVASGDAQFVVDGKPQLAFRKGDILVRHGTSSERWTQEDADFLVGRARESQKAAWISEFAPDFKTALASALGSDVSFAATPAVDASAFQKPVDGFQQLIIDLLRKQ